jgi:glycosyltransferase involved in cell wall biosynthesis
MKVLVNAITAKMGGFKTLINSFIDNIDENDGNDYHFLVYEGAINKALFNKANTHIIETSVGDMNHFIRFFWYQIKLPKIIKQEKFDYMINLTNYGPTFPGCKEILLLHNPKHVSKEIYNTFNLRNKFKLVFQDLVLKLSLKGAHLLVVQTNYMKQGVAEKFKYPKDKIIIIPNAPTKLKNNKIDSDLEYKLISFIESENNVLSNITLYSKHKNLELLLEAIKYIKDNNLCKIKLILTVDKNENDDANKLINMIDKYNIHDYVMSVGNIKHEYIHQILNKSKAFVFPSYAETLGIPFIEAMRFGLPIIGADLGFAHDVCGDSALYFKYNSKEDLAKSIVNLLNDSNLQNKLIKNSSVRSDLYKEDEIVRKYLELLK